MTTPTAKESGMKPNKEATKKVMLRIAELKNKAYSLKDTPEEYVKKCQKNSGS